jgi:signal transduction histidine kinase
MLQPENSHQKVTAEQNSNQPDNSVNKEDVTSPVLSQELLEYHERIKLAMEIGGMHWWEWDVPADSITSGLIKLAVLDLDTDHDGKITSSQYTGIIHKEDRDKVKQAFEAFFAGQTEFFDAEYRITDCMGEEKWFHDRGVIVNRTPEGKALKAIGLVQDISNHKQIQLELLEAIHRAEEADRLKTAFLTNMSHEIRTPMNAIIGFSELLADPGIDKEDIANYTKIIKNRSSHLLQIVNDILDISRIEANLVELKESSVMLNRLLDDMYLVYAQKLIDEKKFRIKLNIVKSLDDINSVFTVDEGRLGQILGNLLDNAIKFTREGSIEFGYRIVDGTFVFHVSDTGIGIPKEKHQVIFERFRQVDTSLARQYGGNGLGLAICKAYVELMGGRIWLESEQGSGSTFYFCIRSVNPEKGKADDAVKNSGLTGFHWKGKRILLVEDDFHTAAFMHELFNMTGVELVSAGTAREALQLFSTSPYFDLVLMDIQLPDKSGIELTQLMKTMNAGIPIIAQTAYAMAGDDVKCIQAGCDDYISKPVNISELFSKIHNLLYC